jgi:OmpA-OmpF porin, OOP family
MSSRRRFSWHVMRADSARVAIVLAVAAHASAQPTDIKGSRDHPLISRYAGSYIIGYEAREYGELTLALGRSVEVDDPRVFAFKFSKSQRVEGKLARILYVAPEGRSSLEILRNYEAAMKTAGFQPLFSCTDQECDSGSNVARFKGLVYGKGRIIDAKMAFAGATEVRYLAAKLSAPGKQVYASLMVGIEKFDHFKDLFNHPLILLEIVEITSMADGMVTVNAESMAKDIGAVGHVAIYGVYFDVDKADVKPESAPALREMAGLLEQQPKLNVAIVGHTDNVGSLEHNLLLSERRAAAVVNYLVSQHKASAARLMAKGVGPLAPVASNKAEEGRAKNRRVELVER